MPVFCDICGSLMKVKEKKDNSVIYICPLCSATKEILASLAGDPGGGLNIKTGSPQDINEVVDESKLSKRGTLVNAQCSKCGHDKAYVVIMQTRAADEPPTRIYRCEKCGHTWREYS